MYEVAHPDELQGCSLTSCTMSSLWATSCKVLFMRSVREEVQVVQSTLGPTCILKLCAQSRTVNLQDAELRKHLPRPAASLGSFTSIKDEVINHSLAEAAGRGSAPMDVGLVKGKETKCKCEDGKGKKTEKGKAQGDERRCFY